ncbi:MAG TPA: hypothetical protein VNN79_04670 [Actinomycetota bacterium]|nr:hypothetical protein [Actinomycetota bacterium]
MARTKDSATTELAVAHAAMMFIAAKGLTEEFYGSGALTGRLCTERCSHTDDLLIVKETTNG